MTESHVPRKVVKYSNYHSLVADQPFVSPVFQLFGFLNSGEIRGHVPVRCPLLVERSIFSILTHKNLSCLHNEKLSIAWIKIKFENCEK